MGNTYTKLVYHIVFSTKDRAPALTEDIRERVYEYIGGIVRGEKGSLLQIGGVTDHVHLLARFRADLSVSDMVRLIKSNSSLWAHQSLENKSNFGWQSGYGAFSVSESQIASVRKYIENQEKHHARRSFRDELVSLLQKHGIEFDERYLLD